MGWGRDRYVSDSLFCLIRGGGAVYIHTHASQARLVAQLLNAHQFRLSYFSISITKSHEIFFSFLYHSYIV